jgi:hypothetical protein
MRMIISRHAGAAQLLEDMRGVRRLEMVRRDDNSRWKKQHVHGDSSADFQDLNDSYY